MTVLGVSELRSGYTKRDALWNKKHMKPRTLRNDFQLTATRRETLTRHAMAGYSFLTRDFHMNPDTDTVI